MEPESARQEVVAVVLALTCLGLYTSFIVLCLGLCRAAGRSDQRLELMFADVARTEHEAVEEEVAA